MCITPGLHFNITNDGRADCAICGASSSTMSKAQMLIQLKVDDALPGTFEYCEASENTTISLPAPGFFCGSRERYGW